MVKLPFGLSAAEPRALCTLKGAVGPARQRPTVCPAEGRSEELDQVGVHVGRGLREPLSRRRFNAVFSREFPWHLARGRDFLTRLRRGEFSKINKVRARTEKPKSTSHVVCSFDLATSSRLPADPSDMGAG